MIMIDEVTSYRNDYYHNMSHCEVSFAFATEKTTTFLLCLTNVLSSRLQYRTALALLSASK